MLNEMSGAPKSVPNNAAPDRAREGLVPDPKARLKDQFHEVCRFKHLALRSEEAYWAWVVRLVRFYKGKIHPKDLTSDQLAEFLTHLATVGQVAASTQNQALNALLFLYRVRNVGREPLKRVQLKFVWSSLSGEVLDQTSEYVVGYGDLPLAAQQIKSGFVRCGIGYTGRRVPVKVDIYLEDDERHWPLITGLVLQ
jgi:hypothetical protein